MMKKKELIACLAKKSGFTKKDTEIMLDCIFDTIGDLVASGEEVQINGFGAFGAKARAARKSVDITGLKNDKRTKNMIEVPAAKKAYFRVGSALRRKINESAE